MKTEYEEFMYLSPYEFDQNEDKGWRKLDRDGRHLEAVEVIEEYIKTNKNLLQNGGVDNEDLERMIHFHAGQILAMEGQQYYPRALGHFLKSYRKDKAGWNYYVEGTMAYLEGNKQKLKQSILGLQKLEDEFGIGISNLDILLCFESALKKDEADYGKAYSWH